MPREDPAKVRTERARAYLKERFHMSDATASQLCIAGETAFIARDNAHHWEFCLKPKTDDTYEVVYTGAIAAVPCKGKLGDAMQWGDVVNVCR